MSAANIVVQSDIRGLSPTSQQFMNRLITSPVTARETLYAALIDGLVAAGIWALLDIFFVFCAADHQTALVNLISTNPIAVWPKLIGTFTANQGMNPQGSSNYLDTQFNFSTATNFTQNSACIFGWNLSTTDCTFAFGSAAAVENHVSPHAPSTGHTLWAINSAAEVDSGSLVSDSSGLWVANRTGASAASINHNGTQIATSNGASTAPSNGTFQLATNNITNMAFLGAGSQLNSTQLGNGATTSLYGLLRIFALGVGLNV